MCGSRGFNNYRHQADMYSWMNVLLNRGYKRENIITISYNDLPELTNQTILHTCHGPNMFIPDAVNFSYNNANKDMFLRTLKNISGRNVNVLIIYINHGAYNMLSTPNSFDRPIYVDDFSDAVNALAKRVRKVCCVIEACYSGSMATRARYENNVLFITAADAKQASYSYCWCPEIKAYTTDEFTYHFLNYLDRKSNDGKYVQDLVRYLRSSVNMSRVISSGSLYRLKLSDFFGVIGKKRQEGILGDTSVDEIKRVKNTLAPTSMLKRIYIRIRNHLNITLPTWVDEDKRSDIKKRATIRMIKNPDVETICYKRVSDAAIQLFLNRFLEEDSIEFLHDIGLLCLHRNCSEIISAMEHVRSEMDAEMELEKEVKRDNKKHGRRYIKDKTGHDVSVDIPEQNVPGRFISAAGNADENSYEPLRHPKHHNHKFFRKQNQKLMREDNVDKSLYSHNTRDVITKIDDILDEIYRIQEQAISVQRPSRREEIDDDENHFSKLLSEDIDTDTDVETKSSPSSSPHRQFRHRRSHTHLDDYPFADTPAREHRPRNHRRGT